MRLSDFFQNIDDDVFETGPNGHPVIEMSSNLLHGVTVDTYQTFNGDSWLESEIHYMSEEPGALRHIVDHPAVERVTVDVEWEDVEVHYDNDAILNALAEAALDDLIMGEQCDIILSGEVTSTYSPMYYNFESDSFGADLEIDLEALAVRADDIDVDDLEQWSRDRHRSYDGFMSFVGNWWDGSRDREWVVIWAALDYVLTREDYSGLLGVAEAEYEIYSEHTTISAEPSLYAKIYTAVTGEDLPTDEDGDEVEIEDAAELEALLPDWQEETLAI